MTFRSRILWLAGLITLAAAFGLLPRDAPMAKPLPKAVGFRL